jgi:hypothetical protein
LSEMAVFGASAAQRIRSQVGGYETAFIALFAPPGKVDKYCQPIGCPVSSIDGRNG